MESRIRLHNKPTKLPIGSQTIFNHNEPCSGKARKTNKKQKSMMEKSPLRCPVKAKLRFEPFVVWIRSEGGSASRVFTTAIRPIDSNWAVNSAKNGWHTSSRA